MPICFSSARRDSGGQATTRDEKLIRLAGETGITVGLFRQQYTDRSARIASLKELTYTRSLGVRGLPACEIQYGEQSALVSGMIGPNGFVNVINQLWLRNQACEEGDGR